MLAPLHASGPSPPGSASLAAAAAPTCAGRRGGQARDPTEPNPQLLITVGVLWCAVPRRAVVQAGGGGYRFMRVHCMLDLVSIAVAKGAPPPYQGQ